MSEDARGGVRSGRNLLEVCAADTAGMHADEKFSGADGGDWDGFEADVVNAAVDRGLHGRGNQMLRRLDRIRSGNGHQAILDDMGRGFGAKRGSGTPEGNAGGGRPGAYASGTDFLVVAS